MIPIEVLRQSLVNRLEALERSNKGQLSQAAQIRIQKEAEDIQRCYEAIERLEQQTVVQSEIISEQQQELMRTRVMLNEQIRETAEASSREFKLVLWIKKQQLNGRHQAKA